MSTSRFDKYTFEFLLNRALSRVPDNIDKREGSIIYDAIAPSCYELAEIYLELKMIEDMSDPRTAVGEYLDKKVIERGIIRYPATKARRLGVFNRVIPTGTRFSIENVNYIVIQNLPNNESILECEQAGAIGNEYAGSLIAIDYIANLTIAELTSITVPGEDDESDDDLRKRYFEDLETQAFGGNQADYKAKTKSLNGVGGCKVYPVWNGGGTVKLVITDSTHGKPSNELVQIIQSEIDPITNQGEGVGIAPIGHIVTVVGAEEFTANIKSNITLLPGYSWEDISPFIIVGLEQYMVQLRQSWDSEEKMVVRISQIESIILQITGVLDIQSTLLNDAPNNLILTETQIPILGTVTQI